MSRALAAQSTLSDGDVVLQPLDRGVAPLLLAGSLDPEVTRWTQIPEGLTMGDAAMVTAGWSLPSQRIARFQLCLPDQPQAGMVSLWLDRDDVAEVGYWLLPGARGRGVATTALQLLCAWAFEACGLDQLQLTTLPGNAASESVARKCGFAQRDWIDRDIKGRQRRLRRWVRRPPAGGAGNAGRLEGSPSPIAAPHPGGGRVPS